jgi:hypothetical protein
LLSYFIIGGLFFFVVEVKKKNKTLLKLFLIQLGLLPSRSGASMSRPAFGRFGGLQLGIGSGSKIPAAIGRFGGSGHEIAVAVHLGTDLQATAGHAIGQVTVRRYLGHRTGIIGRRPLQGRRRRFRSRSPDRHMFPEITRIRFLRLVFRLLGTFNARPGKNLKKKKCEQEFF